MQAVADHSPAIRRRHYLDRGLDKGKHMNLTEAIEQDNARREENEQRETLRNLVSENPFSKEHWNVTRQISAKLAKPELADLLDKCKGVTLPTCIVDDPPADLMAALKEFAASVTKANATISGNGTGEA